MANLNKVMLIGNLTRDVDLRNVAGGQSVGSFGIAVNRNFTTKDGQKKEDVTFIDCEAWGRTAEVMKQYLSKGRPVFIEGRLKFDSWDDKQSGKKMSRLSVVVENFQFLGSRGEGTGGERQQPGSPTGSNYHPDAETATPQHEEQAVHSSVAETDIPF